MTHCRNRINEECLWTLYMMFDPIQNTASC